MRAESLHALILLIAVLGLGLSLFAYAETIDPALRSDCSVNVFFSCAKVDQSGLTTLLGVPDWAVGAGGFALMLAIDIPLYVTWRPSLLYALVAVAALGVAVSAYLAYVELVQIVALCPVCLSAYLSDIAILGLGVALLVKTRAPADRPEPAPSPPDPEAKSG